MSVSHADWKFAWNLTFLLLLRLLRLSFPHPPHIFNLNCLPLHVEESQKNKTIFTTRTNTSQRLIVQ